MARQVEGGQEELINTAYALSDALRQLKAASAEGCESGGVEKYGGGRQGGFRSGSGSGRYEIPGGTKSERNRGRGGERHSGGGWNDRGYRGSSGTSWRHRRAHEPWDSSAEGQSKQHYSSKEFPSQDDFSHNWRNHGRYSPENMRSFRESHKGQRKHWVNKRQEDHRENKIDNKGYVEPVMLVKALAAQPAFSASLLQLFEDNQMIPADVRNTVSQQSHVFGLEGEDVKLQPQLDICAAHCGPQGCQDRNRCINLHICPNLALDKCDSGPDCLFGHKWHTNHNLSILKPLFLDHLPFKLLRELLQQIYINHEKQELVPLSVCDAYNNGSCSQAECSELHICLSFVMGCSCDNCKLNHNLLSPSCCHLLELHGISTNESPRDIVAALLHANPELNKQYQPKENQEVISHSKKYPLKSKNNANNSERILSKSESNFPELPEKSSTKSEHLKKKKMVEDSHSDTSSSSSEEGESKDSVSSDNELETRKQSKLKAKKSHSSQTIKVKKFSRIKKSDDDTSSSSENKGSFSDNSENGSEPEESTVKKGTKIKGNKSETGIQATATAPRRTLWSHYLQGDVTTPEICYHSVEDICKLEGNGCPRLHASHHFHWQVRSTSGKWMNLRLNQVTCLERAFCDPEQDGIDLPRLDPATLDIHTNGLLILLGRNIWHAHFPETGAFTLTNSSKTLTVELRRLCTEVLPNQTTAPMINAWYFLDKNKKWVKYGKVDTVGETKLISSVTSDDVEKHYMQSSTVPLSFKNLQFSYTLDFQTMEQTNLKTKVRRAVRRRPEPHLPDEQDVKGSVKAASSEFPSDWEVMQEEERLRMVTLAPTSKEYKMCEGLLAGKLASSNVMKVQRVQNPFLWRAFQNKIKELTAVYSDSNSVNVCQLFHGTAHNVVASICAENLDWRLHGSASGQMYGRGTYFSTDAAYSYKYSRADSSGMKYMFVVRVAVGSCVAGNSSMVRPPTNPVNSLPYDSTVDNIAKPSIIVKYDKQEYYPEGSYKTTGTRTNPYHHHNTPHPAKMDSSSDESCEADLVQRGTCNAECCYRSVIDKETEHNIEDNTHEVTTKGNLHCHHAGCLTAASSKQTNNNEDQQASDGVDALTYEGKSPRNDNSSQLNVEAVEEKTVEYTGEGSEYHSSADNENEETRMQVGPDGELDWEEDVADPFEQTMARVGRNSTRGRSGRPTNVQEPAGITVRRQNGQCQRGQDVRQSSEDGALGYGSRQGGQKGGQHHGSGNQKYRWSQHNNYREYDREPMRAYNSFNFTGRGVKPWELVEALAECPAFSASLLNLLEWKDMKPRAVREVAMTHTRIFHMNDEKVELRPDLDLCSNHPSHRGCQDRSSCKSLHLCPNYARSWCPDRGCPLGHRWFTDHNKVVLRLYYMERLTYMSIKNLLQNKLAALPPSGQLDVCRQYNGQGCNKQDCPHLHVCLHFVRGLTRCDLSSCSLNHNLLAPDCSTLLKEHGFSTNEAPRDVAVALLQFCPALAVATQPLANTTHKPTTTTMGTQRAHTNNPRIQQNTSNNFKNRQSLDTTPKIQQLGPTNSSTYQQDLSNRSRTHMASNSSSVIHRNSTGINTDYAPQSNTIGNKVGGGGLLSMIRQKLFTEIRNGKTSDAAELSSSSYNSRNSESADLSKHKRSEDKGRKGDSVSVTLKPGRKVTENKASAAATPVKPKKLQTVWSHYLYGDTEINEICYYSVEGTCRNEARGCQRLHSSYHFHWQVSEQGSKWLNLRPFQIMCLERAFCDPSKDGERVPRLDPAKLSQSLGKLLTVLGRDTWQANFQAMVLSNSDQSQLLYIRRLNTQYIPNQEIKAGIHSWFFCDKNKRWVKYGKVDSAGETKLVSSITSADIEKQYRLKQHTPLTFTNASYSYVIDFVTMTQTNQNTNVIREVRRRPEPHLQDEQHQGASGQAATKDTSDLPSFWEAMQSEERVRVVQVASGSAEYQSVVALLKGTSNNVVKIERIQNPFMWRALQNKIKEITILYGGDVRKVDVRQLFHGTRSDVVASICAENFDWRLHGTSSGQACGRGTYFSPHFATSYGYCRADSTGLKYIFVARVAVGSITQGNSSTIRPPINPTTGVPYESTGDGINVVVKYDKQEYCPEYILTLK
ncbi:hypothetical protein Pmani_014619 [Petrolisthes manimaculis]|uniref:Poly [ADP-ribose] polymerase n=1 Tax=Petrolisthes manimaculis TaxID=1843537 RepID=A0AAE1UCX8_9EUCA|nr:hypothetical protein Pmani_014619 [Petrolisthes manimaculis]